MAPVVAILDVRMERIEQFWISMSTQCLPSSFILICLNHSRADVVSRLLSWPPWWPSWLLEWNQFINSKSPCHPNASLQAWAQFWLIVQEQTWFEEFQDGHHGVLLDIRTEQFLHSKSLCYSNASHQVSAQSNLQFGRRSRLKIFKMAYMVAILDAGMDDLNNS